MDIVKNPLHRLAVTCAIEHLTALTDHAPDYVVLGETRTYSFERIARAIRLVAAGARFINLPEPLTKFRVTASQFGRRSGKEMLAAEWQMQKNLVAYGLVGYPRAMANFLLRNAYRVLPLSVMKRMYSLLFHKNPAQAG